MFCTNTERSYKRLGHILRTKKKHSNKIATNKPSDVSPPPATDRRPANRGRKTMTAPGHRVAACEWEDRKDGSGTYQAVKLHTNEINLLFIRG